MNTSNELETQVAGIVAYLRAELGYDGEAAGSLRRQVEENAAMIRTIDQTLRGQGDDALAAGRPLLCVPRMGPRPQQGPVSDYSHFYSC